jgi:hypothetical protein
MRGHELRVFKRAAVVQIGGNPRRAEGVAANICIERGILRAPAAHAPDIYAMHSKLSQLIRAAAGRAEEGRPLSVENASRLQIGVEIGLEVMVAGHFMAFAAF